MKPAGDWLDDLEEKVERYKAALEEIANAPDSSPYGVRSASTLVEIARAALSPERKD